MEKPRHWQAQARELVAQRFHIPIDDLRILVSRYSSAGMEWRGWEVLMFTGDLLRGANKVTFYEVVYNRSTKKYYLKVWKETKPEPVVLNWTDEGWKAEKKEVKENVT